MRSYCTLSLYFLQIRCTDEVELSILSCLRGSLFKKKLWIFTNETKKVKRFDSPSCSSPGKRLWKVASQLYPLNWAPTEKALLNRKRLKSICSISAPETEQNITLNVQPSSDASKSTFNCEEEENHHHHIFNNLFYMMKNSRCSSINVKRKIIPRVFRGLPTPANRWTRVFEHRQSRHQRCET